MPILKIAGASIPFEIVDDAATTPPPAPAVDGVPVDAMPGATDHEKFIAACQAAVPRKVPVLLQRFYDLRHFPIDQRYDGLKVRGAGRTTGLRCAPVPDRSVVEWAWLLRLNPTGGASLSVEMENFAIDGNRGAPQIADAIRQTRTTHWGVVVDGGGNEGTSTRSPVSLAMRDMYVESFDSTGLCQIGASAKLAAVRSAFWFNGGAGLSFTRGECDLDQLDCAYNGGHQCNLSAANRSTLTRARLHHGGLKHASGKAYRSIVDEVNGRGLKISQRRDNETVRIRSFLHDVLIEDCAGTGLHETSAGADAWMTGGSVTVRRTGDSAVNFTGAARLMLASLTVEDACAPLEGLMDGLSLPPLTDNTTAVLLAGPARHRIGELIVLRSRGRALGFGTGGGVVDIDTAVLRDSGARHSHLRWFGPSASRIGRLAIGGTGLPIENNGGLTIEQTVAV